MEKPVGRGTTPGADLVSGKAGGGGGGGLRGVLKGQAYKFSILCDM